MGLLIGRIDTFNEVETVLKALRKDSRLRIEASNMQIWQSWEALQKDRRLKQLDGGPIDTPAEVKLLLEMMVNSKIMVLGAVDRPEEMMLGPVDTPQEIKLFMENFISQFIQQLQKKGVLLAAIADAKDNKLSEVFEPSPKQKKKEHRADNKDRPSPSH